MLKDGSREERERERQLADAERKKWIAHRVTMVSVNVRELVYMLESNGWRFRAITGGA
jgi:hypothetical protein